MVNEEKLNKINEAASLRCTAALSKLLNKDVRVIFSRPIFTNVKKIPPLLGSEELGSGVYLPIKGHILGSGLILFPKETACDLCDIMMKRKAQTTKELCSFDEGILKEVGNIILGNYLAILSNSFKVEMIEGMPNFSSGMFGAIVEDVVNNFAKETFEALVIKIEFTLETLKLKGYMLLLFMPEKIEALLNAL